MTAPIVVVDSIASNILTRVEGDGKKLRSSPSLAVLVLFSLTTTHVQPASVALEHGTPRQGTDLNIGPHEMRTIVKRHHIQ